MKNLLYRHWFKKSLDIIYNEGGVLLVSTGETSTDNVPLKSVIRNSVWLRRKEGRYFLLPYQ